MISHETPHGKYNSNLVFYLENCRISNPRSELDATWKWDVNDDPGAPHVQGPVVSLVPEHLRGQVGRRAHHRLPEPLLTDDSGKAEITEFHLRQK